MTEPTKARDWVYLLSLLVFILILLLPGLIIAGFLQAMIAGKEPWSLIALIYVAPAFFFGLNAGVAALLSGAFSLGRRAGFKWCLLSFDAVFVIICFGFFPGFWLGSLLFPRPSPRFGELFSLLVGGAIPLLVAIVVLWLIIRKMKKSLPPAEEESKEI